MYNTLKKIYGCVIGYIHELLSICVFLLIYTFRVQSDSHNLKYMGIDALGRLIKISPDIAEQHQLAVIDCLEVRDVTKIPQCLKCSYPNIYLFFRFLSGFLTSSVSDIWFYAC